MLSNLQISNVVASQSPRKALSENEVNVLPVKQPKLKGMEGVVSQPEQKETEGASNEVGLIAHKTSSYPFDPTKEPMLRDNPRRFVIFPIEYQDIWQMYKKVIGNVATKYLTSSLMTLAWRAIRFRVIASSTNPHTDTKQKFHVSTCFAT